MYVQCTEMLLEGTSLLALLYLRCGQSDVLTEIFNARASYGSFYPLTVQRTIMVALN